MGRIIGIIVVLVLAAAGAGYFLVPPVAARSQTVEIERPAQTLLARLASTPANTVVVEGRTTTRAGSGVRWNACLLKNAACDKTPPDNE